MVTVIMIMRVQRMTAAILIKQDVACHDNYHDSADGSGDMISDIVIVMMKMIIMTMLVVKITADYKIEYCIVATI